MNLKMLLLIIATIFLLSACVVEQEFPWSVEDWTKTEDKIVDRGSHRYVFTKYVKDGRERGHFVKVDGDFELWFEQEEGWEEDSLKEEGWSQ